MIKMKKVENYIVILHITYYIYYIVLHICVLNNTENCKMVKMYMNIV